MSDTVPEKQGKASIPHLRWYGIPDILPFLRPYTGKLFCLLAANGICGAIDAGIPLFQNYAIVHFIGEHTLDTLGCFTALYLLVLLVQMAIGSYGIYLSWQMEVTIDQDVRQALFDHVQTLSFSYFNQNSVGYIHSRVISDPNRIGILSSWVILDAAVDLVYIVSMFGIMFWIQPTLGVLLLLIVPLEFAVTWYFQKHMTEENRKVREYHGRITGNFNEGITGVKTIRTLVAEDRIQKDFEEDTAAMRGAAVRTGHYKALFQSSILFFTSIALALVLWRGGHLSRAGLMQVGALAVFVNYAASVGTYVQELVGVVANLVSCQANIERIMNLLHTEPDVTDRPEVIRRYGDAFHPKKENWEEIEGDIVFEDVTFRYPDGEENVLEHFSWRIKKGSMVAIVGETGAGKSTLVNLVCRFFEPTAGRVLLDGKDLRERSQLWLHSHIGYVLQTPHLFSGTVLENLRYGNPDADPDEILQAVRRVSADRIIDRMEHGLESQVGEDGGRLSAGEKQLLSFARAILADPRILVMDEATSNVDTLTEKIIQDAIGEVTKGRTSFVIAHRLSTIRSADQILAMRDGKVEEAGTHHELMAKKGYYYQLYTMQFRKELEKKLTEQD